MRIRAIDWLRGFVMLLMTVDHAGSAFDAAHLHNDGAFLWMPGSPLPAGEFLTRWISHLCAPTFVLLAGASLALSAEKRRDAAGKSGATTSFIVKRGLFIVALDPIWMSLAFLGYRFFLFQVLYAIGLSLVCMAFLRRLPTRALVALAIAIQAFGELSTRWHPQSPVLGAVWALLFVGGKFADRWICAYPLVPWLSIMMFGWVLGRWLLEPRSQAERARFLFAIGVGLLATFGVVRGVDGYGNWNLHRDSVDLLQWLHVSKYAPCIAFTSLELGIACVLLAALLAIDAPSRERPPLRVLSLFGSTAFFYYLLHAHLIAAAAALLAVDTKTNGLAKTWAGAAIVAAVLAWPCVFYRRYKMAHPDGLARYV